MIRMTRYEDLVDLGSHTHNLRSAHTMGLVPATSRRDLSHRVNWQLVPATSRRDQLHRVSWPFLLQNLVAGTN